MKYRSTRIVWYHESQERKLPVFFFSFSFFVMACIRRSDLSATVYIVAWMHPNHSFIWNLDLFQCFSIISYTLMNILIDASFFATFSFGYMPICRLSVPIQKLLL